MLEGLLQNVGLSFGNILPFDEGETSNCIFYIQDEINYLKNKDIGFDEVFLNYYKNYQVV